MIYSENPKGFPDKLLELINRISRYKRPLLPSLFVEKFNLKEIYKQIWGIMRKR